jgi:hypothetical protein
MQQHELRIKELELKNEILIETRRQKNRSSDMFRLTPNKMKVHLTGYSNPSECYVQMTDSIVREKALNRTPNSKSKSNKIASNSPQVSFLQNIFLLFIECTFTIRT